MNYLILGAFVLSNAMASVSFASTAAFCKVEGVANSQNMPMIKDSVIALYSNASDETDENSDERNFNPAKLEVSRWEVDYSFNGNRHQYTVITTSTAAPTLNEGRYLAVLKDDAKNTQTTVMLEPEAQNRRRFKATIIISDLQSSLSSISVLSASCHKVK